MSETFKKVSDSAAETLHIVRPNHLNAAGRLFGGVLMQWIVVVICGKITYVGNTSMEVRVDSYVEDLDGVRTPINRAYFSMVALDDNDKPCRVPRLELETDEEKEEWEKAKLRKEVRMMRKEVGI